MREGTKRVWLVLALAVAPCTMLAADEAQDILDAAGTTGGFIVHVGCQDGSLATALGKSRSYVVHGLDTDPAKIREARQHILAGKHGGRVSAARFDGEHLPYVDSMVNVVVCSQRYKLSEKELTRVLCPGGVALIREGNAWKTIRKPRPPGHDAWTHYLHAPDNNAVSKDTAISAPLRHLQWKGSPRYARHHDKSSSVPAAVTTQGRLFYIMDEGPRASILWAPQWRLVARDAFNGVILWRRSIDSWTDHLWPLKSGPSVTPRRLVAVGDSVYVTLGLLRPVSKLDAVTGKTLRAYAGTEKAEEILLKDGTLYLVINPHIDPAQRGGTWKKMPKTVMAVNERDGAIVWRKEFDWIAPVSLTLGAARAYLCNGPQIVGLDLKTGDELWKSQQLPWREKMPTYFAPTLVAAAESVLYAGGEDWKEHAGSMGLITCLDGASGKIKWQQPHLPSGYQSPQDIFVIGNRVWCGSLNSKPGEFDKRYPKVAPSTGQFVSYNLETGKPEKEIPRGADCYWFHHRCHRAKATEKFFLTSRTGIEMIDIESGQWHLHHWARGACLYGIIPANGLIYGPPHPCACYPEAKLSGFNALAAQRSIEPAVGERLEKGPAYAAAAAPPEADESSWPTFRSDAARSGSTRVPVKGQLAVTWKSTIGGKLSQPVVAGDRVFVAAVDDHALHALDRKTGRTVWRHIAGGRIDSPPTIHRGTALFGSADGYVTCLRATDGVLVWRFRAAPCDRRLMAWEQLESVWPVHGSVLVRDDVAYVIAGRSMFLDGGLTLYRLNPVTGEVLSSVQMDAKDPNTGMDLHTHVTRLDMPVASSDILSSEGDYLFMRSQPFDLAGKRARVAHVGLNDQRGPEAHLFVPNGFLDDAWWHRAFWVYGRSVNGGPGYGNTGRSAPAGKIMVLDRECLYIFGRRANYWRWTTPLEFQLSAVGRKALNEAGKAPAPGKRPGRKKPAVAFDERWKIEIPLLVRAMVKAGETIFAAGPVDIVDEQVAQKLTPEQQKQLAEQAALFAGRDGSILWAVAAADGVKQQELKLDVLPVFDGMIAAGGRLYMATVDGSVVCLAGK